MRPEIIPLPEPSIGAKAFLVERKGLFVFEVGPGMIRGVACAHAGSGALTIYDGLPDGHGFFPNPGHPPIPAGGEYEESWPCRQCSGVACPMCRGSNLNPSDPSKPCPITTHCESCRGTGVEPAYWMRNGRRLYQATQAAMGMWMLDAGFEHGLTVLTAGGTESVNPFGTLTWMAARKKAAR